MLKYLRLQEEDFEEVANIYNYYVENSVATYDTVCKTGEQMRERILKGDPFFSYGIWKEDELVGYVYISPYSDRLAYARTVTISIYLKNGFLGKCIGSRAIEMCISLARERGFKCIISTINSQNLKSKGVFLKAGFVQVGQIEDIGEKFGLPQGITILQLKL